MNSSFADFLETREDVLTANEVCGLLGIHRDTLYRWVRTKEIPALHIGSSTKRLLRFAPKDLATWVREQPYGFHGPARAITDWMEMQSLHLAGPGFVSPVLRKAFKLTGYDWMATAQRIVLNPDYAFAAPYLLQEFFEAVGKLSVSEQAELLDDVKSGKLDAPVFMPDEEDE
jgi:excisionase family DNA binding protein